ncbi:hypothetical protein EZV62_027980 [Acer yangbiense]|uniref:Disease resistance N-terminal domain-containing protein n=1 Tax=Acer yangbiense TaxID=1000413 RepID=A0A5C7GPR7_9ROSI|nr:hypothetical protein EZV62_027980 [Acer yangbiense]
MAAEAIVSTVLEQLILIVGKEVVKEVRLVTDVRKEIEKLTSNFRAIRAVLIDAEQRQVQTEEETPVGVWLDKLKDASYDMDDVLDEWNAAILKLQIEGVENAQIPKKIEIYGGEEASLGVSCEKARHSMLILKSSYNINISCVQKLQEEAMQPGRTKEEGIKKKHEFNRTYNTNVGLQNRYATENFIFILKMNTLEAPGEMEIQKVTKSVECCCGIDLSYKRKFMATNAEGIDGSVDIFDGWGYGIFIALDISLGNGSDEFIGSWLQCAEHWRHTFCVRLVSAQEYYPSISSNSSLVVMGIFDFTKVLSAQIPFTSYGFNAPTNNEMLSPRWMNEVASGNVTSLGVSSQSNAAAGEDSNEVEDMGLLLGWMLLEATLNAGIGGNVGIEKACNSSITFNSYKYNIRSLIVTYSLYVPSSNIIYYEDMMVVGIIDLKRFIMRTNTYVLFTLEALGEMEIMKVSYQSNAVGGTSNKVEDEIAVKTIQVIQSLDTVGFISDFPIQSVDAFRATLEEAMEADLLVD